MQFFSFVLCFFSRLNMVASYRPERFGLKVLETVFKYLPGRADYFIENFIKDKVLGWKAVRQVFKWGHLNFEGKLGNIFLGDRLPLVGGVGKGEVWSALEFLCGTLRRVSCVSELYCGLGCGSD